MGHEGIRTTACLAGRNDRKRTSAPAAAHNGLGILVQPAYIVYEDLAQGRLVSVLDTWDLPRLTINIAYPSRKHLSAKVRSFIDFMVEHFAREDYERKWTGQFGELAATKE
jgi:DNA-binding transcriptional LysR family regulator